MQVLKNPHVIPPATDLALVKETALRRQLKADLTEINLIIKNFNKNDFLTEAVKIWYDFFCKSLETNQDIDNIYRKHLESLQLILADFSDEVFLGNDTNCYSKKTLCLLEHTLPEAYWFRSPHNLSQAEQEEFCVVPHNLVNHMLSWLKKNGHELKASAEVEFAYQELVESLGQSEVNRLIPLQRNNRLKRIRKAQAEKANQQARAQAIQTQIMNLEQEVTAEIKQEFAELAQKASDICDQALIKLAVITEKQNSAYESTSKEIDKLERKIAITKVQTEQLEISISQTNEEIEKVYQEQLKLATSIDEVAKAIKKRKKKRQKNLTKTIIVVVGCIAGGAIVAQFFPGITILPSVEGNGISTMIRI